MMLPEHKEKLIQQERDDWKVDLHGPLDDDQWYEIGLVVMDALNRLYLLALSIGRTDFTLKIMLHIQGRS